MWVELNSRLINLDNIVSIFRSKTESECYFIEFETVSVISNERDKMVLEYVNKEVRDREYEELKSFLGRHKACLFFKDI